MTDITDTPALRDRLARGELTAADLAERCLDAIAAQEQRVQAWAWIDPGHVRAQARAADRHRADGKPLGALHGLPVGLKDVIDTAGIPTGNGTPLDAGRVPERDAWITARLKAEGAIVMGKTVTTELAFLHPGKTRNPANPAHTPGGSSSGSAAAVAAGMVPLAVGTQTGGSMVRPAAFCGVTGFKPSFGAIPRTGVLEQSPMLDTLGTFGRTPACAALLAEALFGHDPGDRFTAPRPHPRLLAAAQTPGAMPRLAFVRPPRWADADPDNRAAVEALAQRLGAAEIALPVDFEQAARIRARINNAEMAACFRRYTERDPAQLSGMMRAAIAEGDAVAAPDYIAALGWRDRLHAAAAPIWDAYDAILTPATLGAAPQGLGSTGDSIFNGLWTLTGSPAITIPVLTAANGLPLGAQLVGRRGEDARLLATAQRLYGALIG
ncbi:amidase [Rhodobacteraceae bacterium 2CG4]|uniref:Amidase n=1 Tax=Halovulum marinum TaxID=2662447 RepID=A0A6L5Z0S8_9RHOB|nr:amidase [Halovulum marinum]MSU90147.1 amidase [Halovulum marinum]